MCSNFGMPDILHSDQGRNFESTFFINYFRHLAFTKPGQQHTIHRVMECFNYSLLQLLRCYVESEDDWECYLPLVLYAYCTAQHSSTGASPFQLMFGNHHLFVNPLLLIQIPTQFNYKLSLLHCKILSILTFQLVLNTENLS